MPIDQLPPGPELDALMAEKVMGWQVTHYKHHSVFRMPNGEARYVYTGGEGDSRYKWEPSVNPDQAGMVRRQFGRSKLDHYAESGGVCRCSVGMMLGCHCGECLYSEVDGDKARAEALAVCRAAAVAIENQP